MSQNAEGYQKRTVEPGKSEPRGKANRRMSNVEPQNVEGWYRCALSIKASLEIIYLS
jgi:hypothetical protein